MIDLGINVWRSVYGGGVYPLESLFANGENGFLFGNVTDLTRQFTLPSGRVNIAADTDPVGLLLDNHSWGGLGAAQVLAAQPELLVNGGFDVDANWSKGTGWTIGSSKASKSAGSSSNLTQTGGTNPTVGREYVLTYTVADFAGGQMQNGFNGGGGTGASVTADGAYTDYIQALNTQQMSFFGNSTFVGSVDNASLKLLPGNMALQGTTTKRLLWKAGSGKPYLSADGNDDGLVTPYIPGAAGTAIVAFNPAAATTIALGGGASTGNHRLQIGVDASGLAAFGLGGDSITGTGVGADVRGTNVVLGLTWDAGGRVFYVGDSATSSALNGAPDGTGGGICIAAYNNNGTLSNWQNGPVYGGLARSVRSTDAEMRNAIRTFKRNFP